MLYVLWPDPLIVPGRESMLTELIDVLRLKGDVSAGRKLYETCAACHGMDGKGNPAMGAPNLTDDVWLHGWGEQAIIGMVNVST